MIEHTPTPWSIDDDGPVVYLWVDAVKDYVGMTSAYGWGAPHKANAEFIVKAVNNHYALVETLKFLLEVLEIQCIQRGTDITTPTPDSAIGRARDVLAVVGGSGGDK